MFIDSVFDILIDRIYTNFILIKPYTATPSIATIRLANSNFSTSDAGSCNFDVGTIYWYNRMCFYKSYLQKKSSFMNYLFCIGMVENKSLSTFTDINAIYMIVYA